MIEISMDRAAENVTIGYGTSPASGETLVLIVLDDGEYVLPLTKAEAFELSGVIAEAAAKLGGDDYECGHAEPS